MKTNFAIQIKVTTKQTEQIQRGTDKEAPAVKLRLELLEERQSPALVIA